MENEFVAQDVVTETSAMYAARLEDLLTKQMAISRMLKAEGQALREQAEVAAQAAAKPVELSLDDMLNAKLREFISDRMDNMICAAMEAADIPELVRKEIEREVETAAICCNDVVETAIEEALQSARIQFRG